MDSGRNVLRAAPPTVIVICATVFGIALVGAVVLLVREDKPTTDLIQLVNTLLSAAGVLTGTGALLYASAAARSSSTVERKVENGHIQDAVRAGVEEARAEGAMERRAPPGGASTDAWKGMR